METMNIRNTLKKLVKTWVPTYRMLSMINTTENVVVDKMVMWFNYWSLKSTSCSIRVYEECDKEKWAGDVTI